MANTTSQSYTFDKTLPIEELIVEDKVVVNPLEAPSAGDLYII